MEKKSVIFCLLLLVQILIHGDNNLIKAQSPRPDQVVAKCRDTGNFKSESVLKHRDAALDALSSNLSAPEYTGFRATRAGSNQPGDVVNAIMLCPPNIKPEACGDCIKKSVPILKKNCPKQKEAVVWTLISNFISRMVRYADNRIEKRFDNWASVNFSSPQNSANQDDLWRAIYTITEKKLNEEAAGGDDLRKFAAGNITYGSGFTTVYVAIQCTPDISKDECLACLKDTNNGIRTSGARGKMSGRDMSIHCYSRYAHNNFLPNN